MPDWGAGKYELTAAELEPVARRVVATAQPRRGEKVLDIACGTGNAALLAARLGARVTGLDQAPRLIDVARERAAADGLAVDFVVGEAEKLGFDDASFDLVVSVFGVIFAPDPLRAFSEIVRVMRPGGRAFITAWLPEGAIHRMVGVFIAAVGAATGSPPASPALKWYDPDSVRAAAARHGVDAGFHDGDIGFTAASPEDYLASNQAHHPMSLASTPLLQEAGTLEAVLDEVLQILKQGNEDPGAFRVTSRYRIIELRRPPQGG